MSVFGKIFGKKNQQENRDEKVDVNKPVENPRLVTMFGQMKENASEEIMNQVFEEIALRSKFLAVVSFDQQLPSSNETGKVVLEKDTKIQFPLISTQDNHQFHPFFTDWNELRKWNQNENVQTIIVLFDDLVSLIANNESIKGAVINPFGVNLVLTKQQLVHMKTQKDIKTTGVSKVTTTKDTKVMLGEPSKYPHAMVAAIETLARKTPEIKRIWLRLMVKENEQSYLLIVDQNGVKEEVFRRIANVAIPHLHGMYIDMILSTDDFGQRAIVDVVPFYTK